MIQLRFEITDDTDFGLEEPERESPAAVEYGMFYAQIIFTVDETDLLPRRGTMPLVGFGPRALQRLRLLQAGAADQITIDDSGWLHFREEDGRVRIWTSSCPNGVVVSHAEAIAAFERLVNQTKELLEIRVPTLRRHPQWGYWFPG